MGVGRGDVASYRRSAAGVTANLTRSVYTGGDAQGDRLSNIDNPRGSSFADSLTGNRDANILDGFGGADTLDGMAAAPVNGKTID